MPPAADVDGVREVGGREFGPQLPAAALGVGQQVPPADDVDRDPEGDAGDAVPVDNAVVTDFRALSTASAPEFEGNTVSVLSGDTSVGRLTSSAGPGKSGSSGSPAVE